jgi:hypothetical protein
MKRPNPYANISLERPDVTPANFGAPEMQFNIPQMEAPDTGAQMGDLGTALMGLRKKRFGDQGDMIKDAMAGGGAGGKY